MGLQSTKAVGLFLSSSSPPILNTCTHTHTELSHTCTQLSHAHTRMHTHAHTHTQSSHTHTHTHICHSSQPKVTSSHNFIPVNAKQGPLQLYSFDCKTAHFVFKMRKWVVCTCCWGAMRHKTLWHRHCVCGTGG